MIIPEEWGGAGFDTVAYALALEEIARADASVCVIVGVTNSVCCYPILSFGTDEQKRKYLVPLARGETLGAFCLSEPQAGSDATNLRTRAVRDGDSYVINGTKSWVTSGGEAHTYIVMAVTGRDNEKASVTAFIVEGDTPGLTVSSIEHKMGQRASQTAEMSFVDVRVPAANVLGGEGQGKRVAFNSLDNGRIGIGALSTGLAQGALDEATRYAKERQAFGQPIAEFQAIQFKLANMATETDAARLLTWRAAAMKDAGNKTDGILRRDGQALRLGNREPCLRRRRADSRRQRLFARLSGRAHVPRRPRPDHLRRNQRDSANRHLAGNTEKLNS